MSKFGELTQILSGESVVGNLFNPNDAKKAKQHRYHTLMRGINVASFSNFGNLHTCERKFALAKLELARKFSIGLEKFSSLETNIDFAFGRCFETGIQGVLLNKPKHQIFFDMFLAWEMALNAEHPRGYNKTFVDATIAVDRFYFEKQTRLADWEIALFNNKPAIELSFCIDLENGYYYVGHVDVILFNPTTNRYKVLEIKTTNLKWLHEALYKNSDQATGYSIILDSIATDIEAAFTFEVFYLVWQTSGAGMSVFEFTKSRSYRASWINTMLLDIQRINIYRQLKFWPKRGKSCLNFGRPCEFLDTCDLAFEHFSPTGEFDLLTTEEVSTFEFDFKFSLKDIIQTQEGLI